MAKGGQFTVVPLRGELKLSREALLTAFREEISVFHFELSQEIDEMCSETRL